MRVLRITNTPGMEATFMSPMIDIKNLSKVYRRDQHEIRPLNSLSLQINKGEFLALVGPSGSGKSTLLNLIAGLDKPTDGEIVFNGENIARMSRSEMAKWRHKHIGFVFQSFNLIPVLTAQENVELPLLLTSLGSKRRLEQVQTALKVVGLADRTGHYPRQLSGGQEQRVTIARAIVTDPDVIIADEPTGDLDAESAVEILELFRELNRNYGKTIIMVTHDARALDYASSCRRLDKGRMIDSPAAIRRAVV
jgi:putative ABC transport system ATP-binding protein